MRRSRTLPLIPAKAGIQYCINGKIFHSSCAGLTRRIHVLRRGTQKDVDGRDKPGHDVDCTYGRLL